MLPSANNARAPGDFLQPVRHDRVLRRRLRWRPLPPFISQRGFRVKTHTSRLSHAVRQSQFILIFLANQAQGNTIVFHSENDLILRKLFPSDIVLAEWCPIYY